MKHRWDQRLRTLVTDSILEMSCRYRLGNRADRVRPLADRIGKAVPIIQRVSTNLNSYRLQNAKTGFVQAGFCMRKFEL